MGDTVLSEKRIMIWLTHKPRFRAKAAIYEKRSRIQRYEYVFKWFVFIPALTSWIGRNSRRQTIQSKNSRREFALSHPLFDRGRNRKLKILRGHSRIEHSGSFELAGHCRRHGHRGRGRLSTTYIDLLTRDTGVIERFVSL